MDPSTWLTLATWMNVVGYKVLYFINNEDQEALGYKTIRCTNAVASHRVYESRSLFPYMMTFKISLIYD